MCGKLDFLELLFWDVEEKKMKIETHFNELIEDYDDLGTILFASKEHF